ncbi:MAG TPA: DUF1501 domain-containing protein [Myxococcaceae bacterium]|nr:DUF1501 domain-containing protein [Myxococcaceae bacterium]
MRISRRELLSGLSLIGLSAGVFGGRRGALAATGDYRALVCVFLFGGNDGNNMVVPVDARYADYAAARRQPADGGLALPLDQLLPLAPASGAAAYGLHPDMPELQQLWDAGALGVLFNVGTLVAPTTKADDAAGRVPRPQSLMSHQDQQNQWQTSMPDRPVRSGWGGRIADGLPAASLPPLVSVAGNVLFAAGERSQPLAVPPAGGPAFGLSGFDASVGSRAIRAAMDAVRGLDLDNALVQSVAGETVAAFAASGALAPVLAGTGSSTDALFGPQPSAFGKQLLQVARIIEARSVLGASRQIFFVSLGGFDTHNDQLNRQSKLLADLSPSLSAFHAATVQLGVDSQVTTFTLSDFARTLQPASGGGSDHAWGNHQLVLGGAVRGRQTYGAFPTLALGGPDDFSTEGRWIPTTSTDQYAATLARWFGVTPGDLASVLPNVGRFGTDDLGFLG